MNARDLLARAAGAGASVDDLLAVYHLVDKVGSAVVGAVAARKAEQRRADLEALEAIRTGDTDALLDRGRQSVRGAVITDVAATLAAEENRLPAVMAAGGSATGEEIAWLVEREDLTVVGSYGRSGAHSPCWLATLKEQGAIWTQDSLRALRFCRKIDAETLIADLALARAHATQHLWIHARPAAATDDGA